LKSTFFEKVAKIHFSRQNVKKRKKNEVFFNFSAYAEK